MMISHVPDHGRRHLPCEVLIVDDHDHSRSASRVVLEEHGFAVIEARSGFDALVIAQISRPRIILMDISLPEIDGLQLTRMLRADPVMRHCAIIALTAFTGQEHRDAALAAGCDAYMTKPFASVALLDVVRLYARRPRDAEHEAQGVEIGVTAPTLALAAVASGDPVSRV
jgi:two-component system cell cycle response regulator DivK